MIEIPIMIDVWSYIGIGCAVALLVLGVGILFNPPSGLVEIAFSLLGAVVVVLAWPLAVGVLLLVSLGYVLANMLECLCLGQYGV